ncbi:MAG: maltokinase [Gaiellales bacterium]|nr:maltokinase [Gaiellales bacterium]
MTPEGPALAALVREQRWFGGKSRPLADVRIAASAQLARDCRLALLDVAFQDGPSELYQLPYRATGHGRVELSLAEPPLARSLLRALRRSDPIATETGSIEFELLAPLPDLGDARPVGGEQSNSSIVYGERAILKAYRRLEPGESPELELLRFLARHGFEHAPRLLGWYRHAGPPITATLGILQAFVPGARDGWECALTSFADPGPFLASLTRLGEVTGHMHAVLASDGLDPCFAPEPLAGETLTWAARAAEADARALLGGLAPGGAAEPVRARASEVLEYLRALLAEGGGQVIRQHGDYHLGQVLWADGDWVVLDFEGEPARPVAERRRKSSPMRDVAGMLRSFAYAAETARSHGVELPAAWEHDARTTFLSGYVSVVDPALLPASRGERERLLTACELEKALYELRYELDNRPDWVHVPVAGILRLLA